MPHRVRTAEDLVERRGGTFAPPFAHFSAARRSASRERNVRGASERSLLARPDSLLRILSWRERRKPRREPSDRLDGPRCQTGGAKRRVKGGCWGGPCWGVRGW